MREREREREIISKMLVISNREIERVFGVGGWPPRKKPKSL
jgi:hypothetical protein